MLFLALILVQICFVIAEDNIVVTPSGAFNGSLLLTRLGKAIYAFRSIRYAEAPVGNLRFQPPKPIEFYSGIYDATNEGPLCPQPDFPGDFSEDCLMLNVYSTKVNISNNETKRPVLIYIHPGAFYSIGGTTSWSGPQFLLDHDVVLVTINYRLGSLGFLSTGDELAPGNNGLKDQVVAMKWVQRNIASFGGDPDSVTLLGYSAGSWSIYLHLLSPMSRGLFHKAIALSGSSLGVFPIKTDQFDLAQKQANILNCPSKNSSIILSCLRTKSSEEIADSLHDFDEFSNDPVIIWSPVIEPDFGQERFLPDHPIKMIANGDLLDIPLISGVTKDEFAGRAYPVVQNETLLKLLSEDFETYGPIAFMYERGTNKSKEVSKALRKFYLGSGQLTNASFTGLAQLYADAIIGDSVNRAVRIISAKNKSPIYYYEFTFQGRYSHVYIPGTNIPYGVVHHDDLLYLFYISAFPYFNTTDPEYTMVQKYTAIVTNFAANGEPIPKSNPLFENITWEAFDEEEKYLEIGKELIMKKKLFEDRYKLWEKLYPLDSIVT